jgi:anaphase-promoting complex subunit 1
MLWVDRLMRGTQLDTYFGSGGDSAINPACRKLKSVFLILSVLFTSQGPTRDLQVVDMLIEEGFTEPSLVRKNFPPGVALPILEVLYRCRNDLALADLPGWSPEVWRLVGREDLSHNMLGGLQHGTVEAMMSQHGGSEMNDDRFADHDEDGLVPLEKRSAMIFHEDNRIHEAARLLRSSRPIFLRVPMAVEVTDHDYERLKQKKLLLLSTRASALPTGRGMLSIGSLRPVAAEPLPIPVLLLKGRIPPTNASLAIDESECPPDMRVWPDFHN